MRPCIKILLTLLITTSGLITQSARAEFEFDYFGQTPPGNKAVIFAPGIISLPDRGEVKIDFSPDRKECYFGTWEGIYYTEYINDTWTEQVEAPFSVNHDAFWPSFSSDGNRLYFNYWNTSKTHCDIWMVERTTSGWGEPQLLPEPINSTSSDFNYTETADGTIYIMSWRSGGLDTGHGDIWFIRPLSNRAEHLDSTVNSTFYDGNPCIAPDGSYLIFSSGRPGGQGSIDLYICYNKGNNEWTLPVNMERSGAEINISQHSARWPSLSPDGKYLFFTRYNSTESRYISDIYWVSTNVIDDIKKTVLPDPNGDKVNMGAYGGTLQAGRTKEYLRFLWSTPAVFKTPESVTYDAKRDILYASNFNTKGGFLQSGDNSPDEFISRVTTDGEVEQLRWVTGLNAPTGMSVFEDTLYVVERDCLVEIDIEAGQVVNRYTIPQALFLNDVVFDSNGIGYLTDNNQNASVTIYRFSNGTFEQWINSSQMSRTNGLCLNNNRLVGSDYNSPYLKGIRLSDRHIENVAYIGATGVSYDGLRVVDENTYVASDWNGMVYLVYKTGHIKQILDLREMSPVAGSRVNSADLEYIPEKKLLIIPTFYDQRILAYELLDY